MFIVVKNAYRLFLKVAFTAGGDIYKFLRVEVHEWKPARLNLHHNPMSFPECVGSLVNIKFYFTYLPRHEGLGFLKTVSKLATEHFRAHHSFKA